MSEPNENDEKTRKFTRFLKGLRELCVAHNVVLSTSGDASLRVSDRGMDDDPINAPGIEDYTADSGGD